MSSALVNTLKKTYRDVRLWRGLFVCAAIAIPVTNQLTLNTAMQEERFSVVDNDNWYYVTRVGTFRDATKMRQRAAEDAVAAMFNRSPEMFAPGANNPEGFDLPAAVELNFDIPTAKRLREEARVDAPAFRERKITQSATIEKLKEDWLSNNAVVMTALCKLCLSPEFGNATYKYVAVRLTFVKNPSLATDGRPTLVVTDYQKEFLTNAPNDLALSK